MVALKSTGKSAGKGVANASSKGATKSAEEIAKEAIAESSPGFIGRGMDMLSEGLGRIFSLDMYVVLPLAMAGGVMTLVGKGVGYLHAGTGERVGGWAKAIQYPVDIYSKSNFADLGGVLKIKEPVGKAVQSGANAIAELKYFPKETFFTNWLKGRHEANAGKYLGRVKEVVSKLDMHTIPQQFHPQVLNLARLTHPSQLESVQTTFTGMAEHFKTTGTKVPDALATAVTKIGEDAEAAVFHSARATTYGNLKNAVKNAPAALGKASIQQTAINTAFVGVSALGMFGVARGFNDQLKALRHMYADITGEDFKNVSSVKVLFGSVPAPVAEARGELIKSSAVQTLSQGTALAFALRDVFARKPSGLLLQVGVQGGAALISAFVPSSILPVYDAARKAHATGQVLPPNFIAEFIGTASPQLRAKGGVESPFTQELAKQYAAEKASPEKMMQEIASGALMERVNEIKRKNTAPVVAPVEPQISQVARLEGKPEMMPTPVGKHTKDEVQRRGAESQLQGPAV